VPSLGPTKQRKSKVFFSFPKVKSGQKGEEHEFSYKVFVFQIWGFESLVKFSKIFATFFKFTLIFQKNSIFFVVTIMGPKKSSGHDQCCVVIWIYKEPPVLVFLILQKDQRTARTRYVENLKEPVVFMKELVKDKQFYRRLFEKIQVWRNMVI
jgi:hypothetical protein